MTPTRLSEILTLLRWTPADLARETRVLDRTARRWRAGDMPVPEGIAEWLEEEAAWRAGRRAPEK